MTPALHRDTAGGVRTVTLRLATYDDADRVLAWRNDPVTVATSQSGVPVDPREHRRWFLAQLDSWTSNLHIVEVDGVPAGYLRAEADPAWIIAIAIDPARRGQGIGTAALLACIADYPADATLVAWVRHDNAASLRCFGCAGFTLDGPRDATFLRLVHRPEANGAA